MKRGQGWLCAAAFALAALAPALASAQPADPEAEGKRLAGEALDAYQAQEFEKALGLFEKAREYYPTAQVLRMTGYTLLALKRWEEAADKIEAAMQSTYKPLSDDHKKDAQKQLGDALKHLSTVSVQSAVAGTTLKIDGGEAKPLPLTRRLAEGSHTFTVSAKDHDDVTKSFDVKAGDPLTIELSPLKHEVAPPPPPPKVEEPEPEEPSAGWFPYQGPIGIALAGTGAVLGGIGIGFGVHGASLQSAASDSRDAHVAVFGESCQQGDLTLCYVDTQLVNDAGDRAVSASTAGLGLGITGAVLLATGITFAAAAPWSSGDAKKGAEAALSLPICAPVVGTAAGAGVTCSGVF